MTFVVDSYGDGLKDDGKSVPFLGGFDQWWGQIVQLDGVGSQVGSLSIELFRRHAAEALVDPVVAEVTGNFVNPEEVWLRLQDAIPLAPEIALGTVNWWRVAVREGSEAPRGSQLVGQHGTEVN